MYGDLGYGVQGNAVATRQQLDRIYDKYDFVHHVGDVGYADDSFLHDPFHFQVTPLAALSLVSLVCV
jgi:hypothetical protein